MTLMFGDLTISFVNFGKAVQAAFQDESGGNREALDDAASNLPQRMLPISYTSVRIVYLNLPLLTSLSLSRRRHVHRDLCLHGHLGS